MSLSLGGFRNHAATRIEPGRAGFVLLTGANGAGKTNILEAVSLLAVGRGLRGAALSHMAAAGGEGGFQLRAELLPDPGLPPVLLHSFTLPAAPERRQLRVNGAAAALSTLADWSAQLWLTPAMDRLFSDSASARRRFLDRLVLALSPGHGGHANRYEAAMRARTRLLTADTPADPAWLEALEAQMAEHGAALLAARADTVAALSAVLAAAPEGVFPKPAIALSEPEVWPADALRARLQGARGADRAAGRATFGPHRADLLVTHAEKAMPAALASTGEQKALLISILLAHAALTAERSGRVPLLLLDEAAAHLDPERRRALFQRVSALGGQAWLTGTDAALFEGLEAERYHVAGGGVEKA
nr:DNA replication/repair protein RecF [Sandaracinobacteroides sayramensis]